MTFFLEKIFKKCAIYMFFLQNGGVRYLVIYGGGEGEGGSIA